MNSSKLPNACSAPMRSSSHSSAVSFPKKVLRVVTGTSTWSLPRVNSWVSDLFFTLSFLKEIAHTSVTGYGATTLPAVTESITLDGDVNAAELEAERVATLVDKLSEKLEV